MESYVPMWEKQYLIVCCDSTDGLRFVEHYKTQTEAEKHLQEFYKKALRDKECETAEGAETEIYCDKVYLHITRDNGLCTYNKWMEIVQIQVAI